jgi:hypothetical protein
VHEYVHKTLQQHISPPSYKPTHHCDQKEGTLGLSAATLKTLDKPSLIVVDKRALPYLPYRKWQDLRDFHSADKKKDKETSLSEANENHSTTTCLTRTGTNPLCLD